MFRLKNKNSLILVGLGSVLEIALLIGVYLYFTPQPAFSRAEAIARAEKLALMSAPEMGIMEARIDEVQAELMSLSQAQRRLGIDSTLYADPQVWLVTMRGRFVYEGFPMPETRDIYESNTRFFIYNAATGVPYSSGVLESVRIGSTPRSP
jgi:hypothetical protein